MPQHPPFVLFGSGHLGTVAVALAACIGLAWAARSQSPAAARRSALVLAVALVAYRTVWMVHQWLVAGRPLLEVLPFHLCGLLYYLCGWMLWRRSYAVYEVAYFWCMAGTLQALLTPDIRFGFPHPEFLNFILGHAALILAVLYATFVFGFRPRWGSVGKAWLATAGYAALLLPLNLLLGTNHMYLVRKPAGASLLDYLGPWPWYLVIGLGVAWLFFAAWYLPFVVARRRELATAVRKAG